MAYRMEQPELTMVSVPDHGDELQGLRDDARQHALEASEGRKFTIGSKNAYKNGYSFEYRATDTPGIFMSEMLPDTARTGEVMWLAYHDGYWIASCGTRAEGPRQQLFRTNVKDLWNNQWIGWEINQAASKRNEDFNLERWQGSVWCQTRWVSDLAIMG